MSSLAYRPGADGVCLTAAAGALVVVTGRLGSGKSTLLRAILGLTGPVTGEIRWNGTVVRPADLAPPRCAYVPQVPRLFTGTLRENVTLGTAVTEADLGRALRLARLEIDLAAMPEGTATAVGPRGLRLSGGQLQRVAIARALVRRPDVVFLDDASSALDGPTERELFDELRRDGVTVVAVSHRRRLLESADQVVLLGRGGMIGSGTLAELLADSDEMRSLWASYAGPDGA